ncbi:ABC transporter ATP-binding protein [Amedibacillus sp. YH-ame6]
MEILRMQQVMFANRIKYPNINIKEHEIAFISGDSGCGKTTLFKLLNGTVKQSSGDIYYRDKNLHTMDKIQLRRDVLMVSQVPYLFSDTIVDNFKQFHDYHESECPKEEEIKEYLEICCFKGTLDTCCDTMSGGERQRIFQSIALSLKPKVLLLDEPTSALQAELSIEVMHNIVHYVQEHNMTLVVISHDASLIKTFAQNHIELRACK